MYVQLTFHSCWQFDHTQRHVHFSLFCWFGIGQAMLHGFRGRSELTIVVLIVSFVYVDVGWHFPVLVNVVRAFAHRTSCNGAVQFTCLCILDFKPFFPSFHKLEPVIRLQNENSFVRYWAIIRTHKNIALTARRAHAARWIRLVWHAEIFPRHVPVTAIRLNDV